MIDEAVAANCHCPTHQPPLFRKGGAHRPAAIAANTTTARVSLLPLPVRRRQRLPCFQLRIVPRNVLKQRLERCGRSGATNSGARQKAQHTTTQH